MASLEAGDVVVQYEDATYRGQVREGTETQEWPTPHGHGVKTYANGSDYAGEWRDGNRHGRGVCRFADGRVFDGAWADGFALQGTALEPGGGGALSHATFDGKIEWGDGWGAAERVAAGRVVEGRPAAGGGVWIGTVDDAGGARYAGELRGLRPCGEGVLTEGGARFRVVFADGAPTLAEGGLPGRMPAPALKEVCARRRARRAAAGW
jgi:hypothetical protein